MASRNLEITVRVEGIQKVAQLLDDAYEALAELQSQGWDMFSQSARDESSEVMRRIDEVRGE